MGTRRTAKRQRLREEAIAASDRVNNLPDDCLFHIFSFLPVEDLLQVPKVCKRWRDFGSDIWRYVKKLDLIKLGKTESVHKKLIQLCGKHLRDLTILVKEASSPMIQLVTSNCPHLVKFRLQFKYSFSDKQQHCQDLQQLFSKNKETLRNVVLDNIRGRFAHYADCLLELPEELIELQLWGSFAHWHPVSWITPFRPLIPAIERFVNLEILVLNGLQISGDDLKMIETFKNLRKLEINKSFPLNGNLDPGAISTCRKLEYLSLTGEATMNNDWFRDLLQNNSNLKHLKLEWPDILPRNLNGLFEWSQLESLRLRTNYEGLDFSSLSGLKKLEGDLSDRDIIAVLDAAPELEFLRTYERNDTAILTKATEVMKNRNNNIPLHMIIDGVTSSSWRRRDDMPPLLTIETHATYEKNNVGKYTGYEI